MIAAPSCGGAAAVMDVDEEVVAAEPIADPSWQETWRTFDVDPLIAEAVVWPETERYRKLQDLMETAANYGSYITNGKGPDYSIGIFQMKPSFVEELEKAWMRSGLARKYELWFDTDDTATARRIRISRMRKEEWQVIYVGMFMRLLYASYGSFDKNGERTQDGLETLPIEEQVRLAATAYNRGCVWAAPGYGDLERLREHAAEKHFHYAVIPSRHTRRYCYATLAWRHYKRIAGRRGRAQQPRKSTLPPEFLCHSRLRPGICAATVHSEIYIFYYRICIICEMCLFLHKRHTYGEPFLHHRHSS